MSRPGLKAKLRRDGSVAFSTYLEPWTKSQTAALSKYVGVPLTDAKDSVTHTCPVCGYPRLDEPSYFGAVASHDPGGQLKALLG